MIVGRLTKMALVLLTATAVPLLAQTPPIFRYISIAPYGRLELGGPFAHRAQLGKPLGPQLYELQGPGGVHAQFADTERLLIELDNKDRIRTFYFLYLPGKAFGPAKAEYVESLGQPAAERRYDSAGVAVKRAVWQDAKTEFELRAARPKDGPERVASRLRDRTGIRPK